MIKLACSNVKRELVVINGFTSASCISIRIRSKNKITKIVEDIIYNPKMAINKYEDVVNDLLVITSTEDFLHNTSYGRIFVESILREREARIAQKKLIDFLAAEKYLRRAAEYDRLHRPKNRYEGALETAKDNIINVFSLNFLSNFSFVNNAPAIDKYTLETLESLAFDKRFSFIRKDDIRAKVERCFIRKLAILNDDFLEMTDDQKRAIRFDVIRNEYKKDDVSTGFADALVEAQESTAAITVFKLLTDVDRFPTKTGKLRRVANLKEENVDILRCPLKQLSAKKQFAEIEVRTKRSYIYSYFASKLIGNPDDYYYVKEQEMYRKIRKVDGNVKCKNGKLYLPDGITIEIESGMKPYEMLHKVNCLLAAMFGFTNKDAYDGKDWIEGTIRSAYTDEGVGEYRLELIRMRKEVKL